MSTHIPRLPPAIVVEIAGAQLAFVELGAGQWAPLRVEARAERRFAAWYWAIVDANGRVKLRYDYPIRTVTHRGKVIGLDDLMWFWKLPTEDSLLTGIEAALVDPLVEVWRWDGEGTPPAICATSPRQAATPNSPDLFDAVRAWRRRVVPAAAHIIRGLYCPDGEWEATARDRRPEAYYDYRWAGAAAREARAWIGFYGRDGCRPIDRRHRANLFHLRRIYALALLGYVAATPQLPWSEGWVDDLAEAVDSWLAVCADEALGWFFDPQWWQDDSPRPSLRSSLEERQRRREREVKRLTRALQGLLAVDGRIGDHGLRDDVCRHLEQLRLTWYLPRYDVNSAWNIRRGIAKARAEPVRPWSTLLGGVERMYGGVGVGLLAIGLQSDTWKLLAHLVLYRTYEAIVVYVALMVLTFGYLVLGIRRRIGLPDPARALEIWLRGQAAALIGSVLCIFLAAPGLIEEQFVSRLSLPVCIGMVFILAQLALFIGIFTQLLFDDKPTTAPLDAP